MEMQQPAAVMEQNDIKRRRAGGRPWPKGTSGNPSGSRVNVRAVALFNELAADFGGVAALSALDRVLLSQACRLMARAARARDADAAVRLSSEARRALLSLRKRVPGRSAPTETFADIAERAQAEASQRRARELAEDDAAESAIDAAGEANGASGCPNTGRRNAYHGTRGARHDAFQQQRGSGMSVIRAEIGKGTSMALRSASPRV
jgi:hypothetical protein